MDRNGGGILADAASHSLPIWLPFFSRCNCHKNFFWENYTCCALLPNLSHSSLLFFLPPEFASEFLCCGMVAAPAPTFLGAAAPVPDKLVISSSLAAYTHREGRA